MTRARINTISDGQLACLLVITRLASEMLNDSVSLVQFASEFALTALFSLLVGFGEKVGLRFGKAVLTVVFSALAAADCVSYIVFTKTVARPRGACSRDSCINRAVFRLRRLARV